MRQAVFYVNFGADVGLGHLVRCSALAEALRLDGWGCTLLNEGQSAVPSFAATAFEGAPPENAELLVVDHYEPDRHVLQDWRSRVSRVLQIHDGGGVPIIGDVLLNQNADAVPAGEGFFGPVYALVRRAFAVRRPLAPHAKDRDAVTQVLVMPGATDVGGLCRKLARKPSRGRLRYTFVLSSLSRDFQELRLAVGAAPGELSLLSDAGGETIAEAMLANDMLVGNGGSGNFERCALGLPAVSVVMAENQRANAEALAARGATVLAGSIGDERLVEKIESALGSAPEVVRQMAAKSFAVTDGLGAYRVAAGLTPDRVSLRLAAWEDCERILGWQQHPATRRYARDPRVPSREEHVAWFKEKLRDHRCVFNVILAGGTEPAGVVRLDYREMRNGRPCYEVSIFIDPKRHGAGLGSAALREARRLTPFAWRKAFVDERNAASMTLFAGQGYRKEGTFLYDPPLC